MKQTIASFARNISIALVFVALLAGNVFALPPPKAGTLLQEQQENQTRDQRQVSGEETPEKEQAPLQESEIGFMVRGFRFTGTEGLVGEDELNHLLEDAIGKKLGLAALKQLADRITQYIHKKGRLLADAHVAHKELRDGIVEIVITKGKVEKGVAIQGKNLRVGEARLEEMVAANHEGTAANARDIERETLLISDLPGLQAASKVDPGTGRLDVTVSEGPLISGQVTGDNYGERNAGLYEGAILLQANDPFHYGDQLNLNATENPGYQFEQTGYSLPIGYSGLRAALSYSEMRYEYDKQLDPSDLDGGSRALGANLNYPIIRSTIANLWTGAEYDWKNVWDRRSGIITDNKFLNAVTFRANGDRIDTLLGGGASTFNIGATGGALDLSTVPQDLAQDRLGAKNQGAYGKCVYGASRLQDLFLDRLKLFVSVNGQIAFDNLDSSEQFILGGPNGVRAYPVEEASGDTGGVLTSEIRYDFHEIRVFGVPELVGFYDHGWTQLHVSPWATLGTTIGNRNAYTLSGAGVGLNLTKTGVYQIRVAWAAKIGENPARSLAGLDADGKSNHSRCWLQTIIMF